MAEEEKQDEQSPEGDQQGPAKSKAPVILAGSVVSLIALGALAAFMALPSKPTTQRFKGPFHHSLFEEKFSSNLKDNNQRRYLQTLLDCMYFAYDETYLKERSQGALYSSRLRDAVGRIISDKTLAESYEGPAREAFLAELRSELDPILFPVHIGATSAPLDLDEVTGLRPGLSFARTTFRGRFHDHLLKIDAAERTLQIDEGPVVTFEDHDEDVEVSTSSGDSVFVDVTEIVEAFQGEVNIGVHGRTRQLFARELIAQ